MVNKVTGMIFLLFMLAVIVFVVYSIINRLFISTNRRQKTVSATFIHRSELSSNTFSANKPISHRDGHAPNTFNIQRRVIIFRDDESGKELKFSIPESLNFNCAELKRGKLTYSGDRFISFVLE